MFVQTKKAVKEKSFNSVNRSVFSRCFSKISGIAMIAWNLIYEGREDN